MCSRRVRVRVVSNVRNKRCRAGLVHNNNTKNVQSSQQSSDRSCFCTNTRTTHTRQNEPYRLGVVPAGVVGARGRCCTAATVPAAVVFACGVCCCIAEEIQHKIIDRKTELCHHRPRSKAHSNEYENNTQEFQDGFLAVWFWRRSRRAYYLHSRRANRGSPSHAFCSTIASFLIRSWVGAHAFFAARKKNYGHAQRRRKHCRSFSEFPCTYTSVTTYIPLPLWLFPGIRVCTVRRFVASLYFYVFVRQLCCFDFFAHLNNRRTPTLCAPRA